MIVNADQVVCVRLEMTVTERICKTMLFCSIEFIFLFMPIFLLIYYTVPEKYGNLILFLGSLFFYAYGEHRFFWLILVSLVIHYALTRYSQGKSRKCQRICLVVMLAYGFGMLFIFKKRLKI